jgi:iduronate 2-sulfatase
LIIAAPGLAGGRVSSSLVETVDLYPTLAELAGLPVPEGLDGKSLAAVLRDPQQEHRGHVMHVYPRGDRLGRAIRTGRYRMVEWKKPGGDAMDAEFELYDYEEDPLETQNWATTKPEVLKSLQAVLADYPEAKQQLREQAEVKEQKPTKDRVAMFLKRDLDGDGRLSLEEFLRNQPDPEEAPKRFPVFDANGDGFLSQEEFVKSGKVR